MSSYRDRLERCADVLNQHIVKYNEYKNNMSTATTKADEAMTKLKDIDASLIIVQNIASNLQSNIKDKIVSIVQKALDATFPDMYFTMEFVTRRDKTECDLLCTDKNGNKQLILDGMGGGVKDIISFALRVAVWSLTRTASNVIILDEPMKFMSEGMRQQGADLLEVLSNDLGIQFIVVSHVDEIKNIGTTVYKVTKGSDGVSEVS